MVLGGLIIEARQNAGQERPERDWLIVGNVKCLLKEHRVRESCAAAEVNRPHGSPSSSSCWHHLQLSLGKQGPALSFAGALNGSVCIIRPHMPSCGSVAQSVLDWAVFINGREGRCYRKARTFKKLSLGSYIWFYLCM